MRVHSSTYSQQARHTRAAQIFCLCRLSKSYGYRRYAPVIVLRGTVMPRLRRPKLDVAVRYPTLRIGGYNAERKILCRTLFFAAVSSLPLPPCPLREKGRFTRGWKTAVFQKQFPFNYTKSSKVEQKYSISPLKCLQSVILKSEVSIMQCKGSTKSTVSGRFKIIVAEISGVICGVKIQVAAAANMK